MRRRLQGLYCVIVWCENAKGFDTSKVVHTWQCGYKKIHSFQYFRIVSFVLVLISHLLLPTSLNESLSACGECVFFF